MGGRVQTAVDGLDGSHAEFAPAFRDLGALEGANVIDTLFQVRHHARRDFEESNRE